MPVYRPSASLHDVAFHHAVLGIPRCVTEENINRVAPFAIAAPWGRLRAIQQRRAEQGQHEQDAQKFHRNSMFISPDIQ